MMLLSLTAAAVLAAAQPAPPDIRARLAAYEKQVQLTGRADPAALEAIGRLVLDRAKQSSKFPVWSEACASALVGVGGDCSTRLWVVLKSSARPLSMRAEAAAALIERGDTGAPAALFDAIRNLGAAQLAPLAPIIRLMPESRAVPLLIRVLESPAAADQVVGCRALGTIDAADVRGALAKAVASNAPGTEAWSVCMVARARLREPDAVTTLWGYGQELEGEDLLDAAKAMLDVGDDRGVDFLKLLTRRGSSQVQVAAAERLVDLDAETANRVADAKLHDPEPQVRAAALVVARRLKRVPSADIRGMLLDTAELVQLRAAELVMDWAKGAQSR
jgi:HEAT repeat protein